MLASSPKARPLLSLNFEYFFSFDYGNFVCPRKGFFKDNSTINSSQLVTYRFLRNKSITKGIDCRTYNGLLHNTFYDGQALNSVKLPCQYIYIYILLHIIKDVVVVFGEAF